MINKTDYTGFRASVAGSMLTGVRNLGMRKIGSGMRTVWLWKCDCGGETEAMPKNVTAGRHKSCGCLLREVRGMLVPCQKGERRKKPRDMTLQPWGRLTALYELPERHGRKVFWMFRCACGKEKAICAQNVSAGRTVSCGCRHDEAARENAKRMRMIRSSMVASRRSGLGIGLVPHLMPKIQQRSGQRFNLLGDE